jgi:hypothetical protein
LDNKAENTCTYTAKDTNSFFQGYTSAFKTGNAAGKFMGKADTELTAGGFLAFSTLTWGGACHAKATKCEAE